MNETIHAAFSRAANTYPDNVAIWSETGSIAYAQLDQRSSSLALWLRERMAGTGHRVALVMPKSIDAVVAILAILKSGNTYVPLGDNWSVGRLDKIFADGEFSLSIADAFHDSPERSDLPVLDNVLLTGSALWQQAVNKPLSENIALPQVTADDLAYILYTSGSTGAPKGVCVSHRAAGYFPGWARDEFSLTADDRIASVSPLTFDLSTFDLFATLGSGASLFIVAEKLKVFPARFSEFLQTHAITCLYAVPSTLILLTQRGKLEKRDLGAIRTVLFAGESFPVTHFHQLRELLPAHIEYANLYGPTETNVCSFYRVPANFSATAIPIGCAVPGTHLFTRKSAREDGEESGYEDSGELCVAGPAVMSGYYGQVDKQVDYWLDDPLGKQARAYATGDQVSTTGDGVWDYHGRLDKMVKIWGYRVELGEIEACLLELPDVKQVAVVKRPSTDTSGDALIAFVLCTEDSDLFESQSSDCKRRLFDHCKSGLPAYMVPREIRMLDIMPLNSTGKTDRLALEKIALEHNQGVL